MMSLSLKKLAILLVASPMLMPALVKSQDATAPAAPTASDVPPAPEAVPAPVAEATAPPAAQTQPQIVFVPNQQPASGSTSTPAPAQTTATPTPPERIADYIIVDKSDRNLVLFQNGREIRRFKNIRFGDVRYGHKQFQGDEKTPEGLYYINGRNPGSAYHLSLRISYPNDRDLSFAQSSGRDPGGDIFIHGQPNGYKGPTMIRDWTDGCIALSDAEIRELWSMVPTGIPILIQT